MPPVARDRGQTRGIFALPAGTRFPPDGESVTLQLGDGNASDYETAVPAGVRQATDDGHSFRLNAPALTHGGPCRVDDGCTAGRNSVRCR